MATINYWGLSKKGSVTVNLTVTIDQLITAIATDEGLATEHYTVSSLADPSKSSLTFGDSSTTLTQLGLVDGGTVLCTTNQTGSKQERQIQKLDIAAAKRAADGNARSVYDISELPTKYSGNTVVDNINNGGLVNGRPWGSSETPNLFSGLAIWYDTATASTINGGTYSNGTIVTTFTNRATGVNPSSVSADGPTVQTGAGDTLNGYPILRFVSSTGTSDGFRLITNSFDDATGWTMVCLAKPSVTPTKNPSFFRLMDTGTLTDRAVVRYLSQSQFSLTAPTGSATVDNSVDPDGTWKIISVRYDSTAAAASRFTFRWAKTARTVTNGGTPPSGTIPATVGNADLMNAWDSDFAEQVVYNRALSDAEIIALEDYLSSKWAV
jgi:hypothetical protein